jgi:hypothetical protein
MPFLTWLAERVLLVASMIGVATIGGGALGGFLSSLACRAFTSTEGGSDRPPIAEAICASLLRVGIVCLATAVSIGLFTAVDAWRRARSDRKSAPEDAWIEEGRVRPADVPPAHGAWLLLPAFILIVTIVVSWQAASSAVEFLAQNFQRSQGLDGIVLMPPGFILGGIGTLVLADLGLLLLLSARSAVFPRTYVFVVVVHLGLIVCSRTILDAVRSISVPAGSELPMLQAVEAIVLIGVQGLTWSLAVRASGLPLLMLQSVRGHFRPRSLGAQVLPRLAPSPVPPTEPPRPAVGSLRPPAAIHPVTDALPMLGTKYLVSASFLAWPLVGRTRIADGETGRTLTASITPPWPVIEVWFDARKERVPIVTMESRRLFGLGNEFDIRDGLAREPLATVRKPFAGEWMVYRPTGDLLAVIAKERSGFGRAEFIVRMDGRPMGSIAWSNVVRPLLEADFSADTAQQFDRRLGIALGVLVFANMSFLAR